MSRRTLRVITGLALLDILCFALTVHAHLNYHRSHGGPTVMPLSQLLGWIISVGLLFVIAVVIFAVAQAERMRRTGRI